MREGEEDVGLRLDEAEEHGRAVGLAKGDVALGDGKEALHAVLHVREGHGPLVLIVGLHCPEKDLCGRGWGCHRWLRQSIGDRRAALARSHHSPVYTSGCVGIAFPTG